MIRIALFFLLTLSAAIASQEPRSVAETALTYWTSGDAKNLNTVVHPEFKKRCREARIVQFYIEGKEDKKKTVISGSDAEVITILCEALRSIVPPRDPRLEYFDRYIDTIQKDDLMIVVFESGWKRKSDGAAGPILKNELVLKRNGDDWQFLWSPAVQLHFDLTWDPRK